MDITVMGMAKKTKLNAVFISLICSNFVFAGDWQFDPSIHLDETYTDNVSLGSNNQQASLVSQAGVDIETSYTAQQAKFTLSSQSNSALYSHDHKLDNDYHTVASDLRFQLWPNGIILFGTVNISNQSRNGSRNALADIVSADTVRVETYNGGLEYNIDNSDFILNSTLGYRQTNSEDNIGNRQGVVANINSTNGTSARHVFWSLQHSYQKLSNNNQNGKQSQSEAIIGLISDYKINPFVRYYNEDNSGAFNNSSRSMESNSYGLGLRWLISPRLRLTTSYNKPNGKKLDIDGDEQKAYVDAAVLWQPSPRTKLSANFSERFYGNSYGVDLTHSNRRLTNTISYVEDIQALTRNNFAANIVGFYLCPNNNSLLIEECILSEGDTIIPENPNEPDDQGFVILTIQDFTLVEDNVFSLNKTLSWNSSLTLPRTTISFSASQQNRENLDTRIEDELSSASLSIKRKVSGRSSLGFELSYTETSLQIATELERTDRYRRYQLNYETSLNSVLSFNFALSYLNRSSDNAPLNYQEGRVSAKITKGF
ncbi:TIGR03016 family PEP-CTERM system-associated outer membrane protein [Colwellia sp. MB3u-70]|uniref:TIGR03016 family PEP-CTERM system-associated outer membrane protein n=1 Tax=unclassified Colwellia TaxID=196834 RepID=UPI0015F4F218|nr:MULTISPECIES: TIGR03016 family PEP-CTERM system-associated outer membrane protein [unclassified Colwellia]MBA6294090.1 TIGR03016 family PEP-CTERM system-associated outer membrane protein [Colwellia sp. MB3u-8]MBA6307631.1 TIGR03016 family PEP-CTERM system-associated outer membrane protein [Colwellia sp. MB3u-70]